MADPIGPVVEIRHYLKLATIDDICRGLQPVKLPDASGAPQMYLPPVLQYRWKERVFVDGKAEFLWSPWVDVQFAKQGDEREPKDQP